VGRMRIQGGLGSLCPKTVLLGQKKSFSAEGKRQEKHDSRMNEKKGLGGVTWDGKANRKKNKVSSLKRGWKKHNVVGHRGSKSGGGQSRDSRGQLVFSGSPLGG